MIKLNPNITKEKVLKKDNMIILILTGILLLVIAWPMEEPEKKENSVSELWDRNNGMLQETNETTIDAKEVNEVSISQSFLDEEYIVQTLEHRLEEILYAMDGVGQVKVMITLASQGEKIVEKDIPLERSNILEEDSGGDKEGYRRGV